MVKVEQACVTLSAKSNRHVSGKLAALQASELLLGAYLLQGRLLLRKLRLLHLLESQVSRLVLREGHASAIR